MVKTHTHTHTSSPTSQMKRMSRVVVKGRAWVELYAHATLFTKLQTTTNGREKRQLVRMMFHTQLWPPSLMKKLQETNPEIQEVKA